MIQKVAILGATGSIGIQTLSIIAQFPQYFNPTLLTANQSIQKLISISTPFPGAKLAIHDQDINAGYRKDSFLIGNQKIVSYLQENPPDILVIAVDSISCFEILRDVYPYIRKIAIASKEILILAGICKLLPNIRKYTKLLPLDSEHVAIHQLIQKLNKKNIKKIVLTASGGPFFGTDKKIDFSLITPEIALQHPTWQMGKKVTIDSATLINKGIELMEARYLFDLPASSLDVVIHPQSIIHSFCELIDGSVICQMAIPNMELPIAYSLFYPKQVSIPSIKALHFDHFPDLTFRKISATNLPAIELAIGCIKEGAIKELLYLIADDIAVKKFLNHQIKFDQIVPFVQKQVHQKSDPIELNENTITAYYHMLKEQMIKSSSDRLL